MHCRNIRPTSNLGESLYVPSWTTLLYSRLMMVKTRAVNKRYWIISIPLKLDCEFLIILCFLSYLCLVDFCFGTDFFFVCIWHFVAHGLNKWKLRSCTGDDPFWGWRVSAIEPYQAATDAYSHYWYSQMTTRLLSLYICYWRSLHIWAQDTEA